MTMVYATPDQLEALTMGERIAVLRDGRIVQTGTPDELYRAPRDSFVATMVGAPPMNLVPGRVRERAGGMVVELPFGEVDASALAARADERRRGAARRPAARPASGARRAARARASRPPST